MNVREKSTEGTICHLKSDTFVPRDCT